MADAIDLGIPGIGPATPLDRGGSAYVYLAEQEDFGRKVAVKVLFDALEDDATYRRFDRECRAIGAVSHHPNIAVVHGRGLTRDERPYLVMEYRAGGSLADRLSKRGRFTEAEAINIGIKIGEALQVAHDAGVLHRDVKPANILLSAYDEPALADFGIARMDGTHKTTEGVFSASVVHASREILDSGAPTPRSDVYALASTMFELVTGAPAFADDGDHSVWAVVDRVLHQDPPDPEVQGVSSGLSKILRRAMDHDPDRRHPSAAAFVADLRELRKPASSRMATMAMAITPDQQTEPVPAAITSGDGGPLASSDTTDPTNAVGLDDPTAEAPATATTVAPPDDAPAPDGEAPVAGNESTGNVPAKSQNKLASTGNPPIKTKDSRANTKNRADNAGNKRDEAGHKADDAGNKGDEATDSTGDATIGDKTDAAASGGTKPARRRRRGSRRGHGQDHKRDHRSGASREHSAGAPVGVDGSPELSRTGLLVSVGIIATGSLAIGLFSALGPGRNDQTSVDVAAPTSQVQAVTTDGGIAPLDSSPDAADQSDTPDDGVDRPAVDRTAGGGTTQPAVTTTDSTPTTEQRGGPFTPELRFPRAEIGPLQTDERYILSVAGVPGEAEYRIIVDGRPVTRRESTPPVYFPKPGRHQLQVEVATDDRVELTDEVEIYVSDRAPTSGYRVNLSAIRSRPENWPEALRQFDQLVADGHEGLEISLSDRKEGSALPFWNFYIRYADDRDGAIAYCEDRGLSNNECYTAEVE